MIPEKKGEQKNTGWLRMSCMVGQVRLDGEKKLSLADDQLSKVKS